MRPIFAFYAMLLLNSRANICKQFYRGKNKGYNYQLQIFGKVKCSKCNISFKKDNIIIENGNDKKIYHTDRWTTMIPLRSSEYKQLKNIKYIIIDPKNVEYLGNCKYEFDIIKELAKECYVWRNKIRGFDFSISKDMKTWTDIEITSVFPTQRWTNKNYLIAHLWRCIRRNYQGGRAVCIINYLCRENIDAEIAKDAGLKIIYTEFSRSKHFKNRKIIKIKQLKNSIIGELR